MAQKFNKIAVKPKTVVLHKNQWVVFPDPFGKHETRVGQIRGFVGEDVEVGVMYTHFTPEVAGIATKPVTSPLGKSGRMINKSYFFRKEDVRPLIVR